MSATRLIAALLAIFIAAARGQAPYDLGGTEKFHRAYRRANGGEITFEPFQELNWEAKARAALTWLNLDRPTPAQIARLSTLESAGPQFRAIDFRSPLDPLVNRVPYLLISISGITPLQPVQLKGTVNFFFDARMATVEHRVVFGTVAGTPARPSATAAFVVTGRPGDLTEVHSGAAFAPSKDQPAVESTLSFRLSGQPFLLVKWKDDFCASSYTLFAAGTTLQAIAGNSYDCDP